jgi:hypothetical protein
VISKFYGFEITDQTTNNFATFQSDFGFLMVVILPIVIVLILLLISYASAIAPNNRLFFLLISGFCLQYLLRLEESYVALFVLFRNVILIFGLWIIFKSLQYLLRSASAKPVPRKLP